MLRDWPSSETHATAQVGAGYTNEQGQKVAVSSPQLAPAGIILDAELTLATPERLWSELVPLSCFLS